MPSKLKFRLIEASSEERGFEAKSLNFQSPFSNGWKSSKSCSYPQQLVLQLENRSNVRKIQIMVHHQLIPEIIEICAVDARGAGNPVVQCLGHVRCMDSQQNSYKSREMKSIYVDVTVSCIILNLHRNFTNPSNPHNQVSIVAINLLGHCPPSQNGDQSYSPLDSLEYLMTNDHQIIQIICYLRKKIQYLKVKNDVMDCTEIDSTCSSIIKLEEVSKQLVSMELRKMKMLDAADNVGAQLVKRKMDQLRLKTYEDLHLRRVIEREIAQEEDDDDFCNSVSIQIVPYEESNYRLKNVKTGSELRTTVGDGNDVMKHDSDVEMEDSNLTSNQIPDKRGEDKKSEKAKLHKTYNISKLRGPTDDVHKTKNIFKNNENKEDANFNMKSLANLLPNNVNASAKKYPDDCGGVSSNMNPEMHASNDNLVVSGGGGRLPSKSPKELKTKPDDHSKSIIRTSKKNKNSPQSKKSTRRSSFTINKNENDDGDKMKMSEEEGSKTRSITDNSDLKNQKLLVRMEDKGYIASPVETSAYASYEDRPLPTHRNKIIHKELMELSDDCYDPVTDTSRLEPLSEQDLKEASVVIDRFGMEIACKLWSKKWQQRLEGLELVRSEMESLKGNMNNSGAYVNNSTLLSNNNSFIGNDVKEHRLQYVKAFDLIFQKNVKDHIFQVFQTLLNLTLSFLVVFQFSNGPVAPKSSNLPTLDLVIPVLVLKLGDNSSKQHREATKNLLIQLYNMPNSKCQSAISSECVKACKSNPSSKLLFLNVLSFMHLVYVESYQDWPMPTDQLMAFLIYCLSSNHFEVRERTEEFVMDVYKNNRQVVRGFFPADENVKIKTAKNILYKHLLNKFDALDGSYSKSNISAAISSQAQQALPQKQKNVASVAIAIKNEDKRQPRQPEPHTESTRKNGNVTLKQQNKTNIPKPKTNLSKFNVEDKFSPATKSVSGMIKISGDSGPNNKENKFIQQHSLHQKNDQRDNLNVQDHELYHDYDDRSVCDFCEIEQPKGSLNEHYKYRCPMLMKCPYCSDLKEVNQFYKHIKGECICTVNSEDLKDIAKDRCPLCKAKVLDLMVSDSSDDDESYEKYRESWKLHLINKCLMNKNVNAI